MRTKIHKHRAVPSRSRVTAWTGCVGDHRCSGRAHGGVTIVDVCSCGAQRHVESNGGSKTSSGWMDQDEYT